MSVMAPIPSMFTHYEHMHAFFCLISEIRTQIFTVSSFHFLTSAVSFFPMSFHHDLSDPRYHD